MNNNYVNYILAAEILEDLAKAKKRKNHGGGTNVEEMLKAEYNRGRKEAIDEIYVIALNENFDTLLDWLQDHLVDGDEDDKK